MSIERFDMDTPLAINDISRRQDVDTIIQLWKQIGDNSSEHIEHDTEFMRSMMTGLEYTVARKPIADKDRVIGAISIMDCRVNLAKIDSLAVSPEYQRSPQKYGSSLAAAAVNLCWEQGFEQITTIAMPSSRKVFSRLGFEIDEIYDSGNALMFLDK